MKRGVKCCLSDIKKLVKSLVRRFGTNDPFRLCELLNIVAAYKDLGNVRGMYQHDLRKKIIHININLSPCVQRQVCAHELGHALLHKKINTVFLDTCLSSNKIETEANLFAAELLIGDIDPEEYEGYSILPKPAQSGENAVSATTVIVSPSPFPKPVPANTPAITPKPIKIH